MKLLQNTVLFVVFLLFSGKGYSGSEVSAGESDKGFADYVVESIAELVQEQLDGVIALRINSDIRENLCGYDIWSEKIKYTHKMLFSYFPETCESVQYSVGENLLLNPSFLETVKSDLINTSVDIINRKFYKIGLEKNSVELKKWGDNHFMRNIYLSRSQLKLTKKILRYYFSTREREYVKLVDEIKNIANKYSNARLLEDGDIAEANGDFIKLMTIIAYKELKREGLNPDAGANGDYKKYVSGLFLDHLSQYSKLEKGLREKSLFWVFLALYEHIKNSDDVRNFVDYRFGEELKALRSQAEDPLVRLKKESLDKLKKDIEDKTDNVNINDADVISAVRTIRAFTMLYDNPDKDNIKSILRTYLADINSRTVRFNERVYSIGALVGYSINKYRGADQAVGETEKNGSIFVPFGLMSTRKMYPNNWMFHFLDLGQYFSSENADSDVSWRDSVAPGVSWFWRMRKYPLAAGVDYTHIPKNNNNPDSDNIVRLFFTIEVPMFYIR